jgi:DNA-binding GntR family transcriptional regulator
MPDQKKTLRKKKKASRMSYKKAVKVLQKHGLLHSRNKSQQGGGSFLLTAL